MYRAVSIVILALAFTGSSQGQPVVAYRVDGDAIPEPLVEGKGSVLGVPGDPLRGRAIVVDRALGNCLICHQVPEPSERFMGDLAPDLKGVGSRLTPGQLRLRLVDQSIINPGTIMPPYHRVERLVRVPDRFRGSPLLNGLQIEDVVAYLSSLKE